MSTVKKLFLVLAITSLIGGFASAQVDPFMPMNPAVLGRGGAFTADAQGYNAFFYNPAGFANPTGEFTLLSTSMWAVMDRDIFDILREYIVTGQAPDMSAIGMGLDGASSRDLNDLMTALGPVTDYLGAAASADPDLFQAAVQSAITSDPALQALLIPGVDLAAVTSAEEALAMIDLAALAADPSLLTDITQAIVDKVDADFASASVAVSSPKPDADQMTALDTAFKDTIQQYSATLPSGNLAVGAQVGAGWVGGGLGIGLFVQADAFMRTPDQVTMADGTIRDGSILDARGRVLTTVTLAGGLGLKLGDNLSIGASIRPTLIGFGDISPMGLIQLAAGGGSPTQTIEALFPAGFYKSFYLGLDAGALLDLGDLDVGVTVKDIIPWKLKYYRYGSIDTFAASLPMQFAEADLVQEPDGLYYIPPLKVNAGIQWNPNFGDAKKIIDLKVGLDLYDVFGFVRYIEAGNTIDPALLLSGKDYNILEMVGLGVDLRLFQILKFQAGYFKRSITGGVGIDLPFMELNIAAMAKDLELEPQLAFSETGLSIELAFRF